VTSCVIYGIKNCDTMKKARSFLEQLPVTVRFHDYRADGVPADLLRQAIAVLGYEKLINQRGTTWRALPDSEKNIVDAESALALMLKHPAVIKRPLLHRDGLFLVGFDAGLYQQFCL